jgi:outer membrane protein TolC
MKKLIGIILWSLIPFLASSQTDSSTITLGQCIEAALNNNPRIKESGNEVSISELEVRTAESGLYPAFSTEVSGGLSNEYLRENNYGIGNGSITANQILWQNGRVKAAVAQAGYNRAAKGYSRETRQRELVLAVKTTYVNCLLQNRLYNIAIDNVSKAQMFLEYASERYRVGVARKSDVLKSEGDLSEAEFEAAGYMNSLEKARNELVMLTGLTAARVTNPENNLTPEHETYTSSSDSLCLQALRNYPDLLMAYNMGLSQQVKIKQVAAERYPQLIFKAGYNWNYNSISQEQKGWYSVLALRWDIFGGNERRFRIQTEQMRLSVCQNQADEVKDYLVKEINNKLISLREAEKEIRLTDRLMKTTAENLEIAKAQYQAGTGSMLELTDSRITDLAAKQKNIRAIAAYQVALANIERLTGNNYENKEN